MAGRVKRVIHRPRSHGPGEGAWVNISILPVKPQGLIGVQEDVQEPVTLWVFQIHWCGASLLLLPRLDSLPHTGLHTELPRHALCLS